MRKKGSITLVMSLIMAGILPLLTAAFRLSEIQCARVKAVNAAEAGLYSVFAEYEKTLLEAYDMFFLDAGYGGREVDSFHILDQMENSMQTTMQSGLAPCTVKSCSLTALRLATDDEGKAFRRQAVRAVKKQAGIKAVVELEKWLQGSKEMTERQQEQKAAGPSETEMGADSSEVALPEMSVQSNPLEVIKEIKKQGILGLVLPPETAVSEMEADVSLFTSHRSLQRGFGALDTPEESSMEKLYMQLYVMDKLGNYQNPQEKGALKYQAEYIIGGRGSDRENLKKTVNRILLIREAVNASYLFTDSAKRAQALAAAGTLCTLLLIPEGTAVVEKLLLLGWAYAESILDVRQLMAGGKISAIKNAENWNLEFTQFGNFFSILQDSGARSEDGLGYTDYLHFLMLPVSEHNLTFRCMDMVEQNIRMISEKSNFSLDSCVESLETEIIFAGPEGKEWTAVRSYGYDM